MSFQERIAPTAVNYVNMNNKLSFITLENVHHVGRQSSKAMRWIREGNVGVMIASNLGRPGGACSQTDENGDFKFEYHACASTQEESALTYIHSIVPNTPDGSPNCLELLLNSLMLEYGMEPAEGDIDEDFLVIRNDKTRFNVRESHNVAEYSREIGSMVQIADQSSDGCHDIYLSFVSGPNASSKPPNFPFGARPATKGLDGRLQLDTVNRTISRLANENYHVFAHMIVISLVASLSRMAHHGVPRVVFAAPSSGLYAGPHEARVKSEYHTLCEKAMCWVYSMTTHRFTNVLIPRWYNVPCQIRQCLDYQYLTAGLPV